MDSSCERKPVVFISLEKCWVLSNVFSACLAHKRTVLTVNTGNNPLSVSAPRIMPSTPSKTAFEISVASALVGLGDDVIESTTLVVRTGLPSELQAWMSAFCSTGNSSTLISIPRLPREMIMPSAVCKMFSKFANAFPVSTLAMTFAFDRPSESRVWRASMMCSLQFAYERDRKSMQSDPEFFIVDSILSISTSRLLSIGREHFCLSSPTVVKLQFLMKTVISPLNSASFSATHCTSCSSTMAVTSSVTEVPSIPVER
mmetsp:Transcript_6741/g.12333  ORF Transcript_6741/g.12333 Transcript_6741/m.12333 type:complete len:258 (+) Transcript_6741:1424-2197(+)